MKKHLVVMEWIHATLIFALFIPFVYGLCMFTPPEGTAPFYLKCLLVAVPVAVTKIAADRVRTLGAYLLVCAALFTVIYGVIAGVPRLMGQDGSAELPVNCYRVCMLAETAIIAVIRLADRIKRKRYEARKETDPLALYRENFLDRPSLSNGYFITMYIAGILFNAKLLCDIALFSAIVYLFLALAYTFFGTTEHYLMLNKRTKGIPAKRLYAVSGGMLCLYAVLLLAVILPSFLLIKARRYTDVREWFTDMPLAPGDYEGNFNFQTSGGNAGGMSQFFMDVGEPSKLSMIWEVLFWGLSVACIIACVYAVVMAIKKIFRDFRRDLDENGDKIEELEKKTGGRRIVMTAREQDSETIRIKRLYKRTIRKHRKDRPAAYESPSEIEEKAGLAEDAAMQTLHEDYERVRYGKQRNLYAE